MENTLTSRSIWEGRRAALVIAHPGHELLVHGWLEQAKPLVFVLTAGPADGNATAITTTAKIVERAGGRAGSLFGRFSDRGLHNALLMREKERFHALAQELADAFLTESIDIVVGDSAEGFDPAHDLCRVLIDAASGIAARVRPGLRNFEFPLIGGRLSRATTLRQRIEGDAWIRKFASCRAYQEPIDGIRRHLAGDGVEALREECLRLATPWSIRNRRNVLYSRSATDCIPAIHFSEHLLPVAGSVHSYACSSLAQAA